MDGRIVPLFRCQACGRSGKRVELTRDEESILLFTACDACIDVVSSKLDRVRPIFKTMLACGVPKDIADRTMIALLEMLDDEKAWP